MIFLKPLGLLGLLGVLALIVIYIIKPNYQNKFVSSTYVWKLSLQRKKRSVPISKLRQILLIICQICFLVSAALILANPSQLIREPTTAPEAVAVIDASASMRTVASDGRTRFEKAVREVRSLAEETFAAGGTFSVVLADDTPDFIKPLGVSADNGQALFDALDALVSEENFACTYGKTDIDAAMALCEDTLAANPSADIYLYTDTTYDYVPEEISVENMDEEGEWNAAILDAYAESEDNYYIFVVKIACYGDVNRTIPVTLDINGANAADSGELGYSYSFSADINCNAGEEKTVVFRHVKETEGETEEVQEEGVEYYYFGLDDSEQGIRIVSYQSVHIALAYADRTYIEDSFSEDNNFDVFGGQKSVLRVQYYSRLNGYPSNNSYINGILLVLQRSFGDKWDIRITEVMEGEPALTGYDLYIFEHEMPTDMPTDGVVFLIDPLSSPNGGGFTMKGTFMDDPLMQGVPLVAEEQDDPAAGAILNNIDANNIVVTRYNPINYYDPAYRVLLTLNGDPIMMVKKERDAQVALFLFSLHYSDIGLKKDYPMLMRQLFLYYFPSVVEGNAFEVNESFSINSLGEEVRIDGREEPIVQFPAKVALQNPGAYRVTQTTYFGRAISENIYIRIPVEESDIRSRKDSFLNPYESISRDTDYYRDLLLWFAIALAAFALLEWQLQSHGGI